LVYIPILIFFTLFLVLLNHPYLTNLDNVYSITRFRRFSQHIPASPIFFLNSALYPFFLDGPHQQRIDHLNSDTPPPPPLPPPPPSSPDSSSWTSPPFSSTFLCCCGCPLLHGSLTWFSLYATRFPEWSLQSRLRIALRWQLFVFSALQSIPQKPTKQ